MFLGILCGVFRLNLMPAVCSGVLCGNCGCYFLCGVSNWNCRGRRKQFLHFV